jgi:hypothetical protein
MALTILLALAGFLACGDTGSSSPAVVTTATITTTAASHFKVGQQVKVGTWVIILNKVTTSKGDEFDKPKGVYVIVDVTIKNTDSQKHAISSLLDFKFQDSTGQQYDEALTALSGVKPPDGDVAANSQLRGQLVYDVPKTEHAFTFTFEDQADITNDTSAVWDVNI